jgi:hypothetical protein
MTLSEPVRAALIGATVTIVVSLIQLTVNARRQAAERAAGKPASKKTGNWLATFALMLASAVGGYAFSEYQTFRDRADNRLLREEMQLRLKDIGAVAARLERVGMQSSGAVEVDMQLAAERRRGAEGSAAVINLPACAGVPAGLSQPAAACTESTAQRSTICSVVPAAAVVNDVQLFLRPEDSQQSWAEAKVQAGQDAGGAKFLDSFYERGREGDTKEVCINVASWGSDKGRSARILVRYVL